MNTTTTNRKMLLNDSAFVNALEGLQSFVLETGADIDMAYDWLCDQSGIKSFCHDPAAFDCFYDVFMDAAN
tara:strand:- start:868 stop:1080 length:213 start_codon:yes stop_codon:yes gene_type:complete